MSRYIFELENGYIDSNKVIMHSCDNPKCINPNHLSLGTVLENVIDRTNKDRGQKGEQNGGTILTDEQVHEICKLLESNLMSRCDIISKFGITKSILGKIARKITWLHISCHYNIIPVKAKTKKESDQQRSEIRDLYLIEGLSRSEIIQLGYSSSVVSRVINQLK